MDHSMVQNPNGRYPYGTKDGIIRGFNGELANAGAQDSSNAPCIKIATGQSFTLGGLIVTNASGCYGNTNYIAYDEHPGYDYRAPAGTAIYAAYSGRVVNGESNNKCVPTAGGSCSSWGMIGIDHSLVLPPFVPQPYITQYVHMTSISSALTAGAYVVQGQYLGNVGQTGLTCGTCPHLHFEVLRLFQGSNNYAVGNYAFIDPYGWTGTGTDPLYSQALLGAAITNQRLWQ